MPNGDAKTAGAQKERDSDLAQALRKIREEALGRFTRNPKNGEAIYNEITQKVMAQVATRATQNALRNIEGGGALTILATALVDTGSRMDELIFQEFKGTGNMELILDRKLADRRLYPAIDIPKSGTRKEEKLFPEQHIDAIRKLRRTMVDLDPIEAMETLIGALKKHKTNEELLSKLKT